MRVMVLLACLAAAWAQPKFEVVSIKPCRNGSDAGGRVEASGARFTMTCESVYGMILDAYRRYASGTPWPTNPLTRTRIFPMPPALLTAAIHGSPGWTQSERYTITAKADRPAPVEMMRGPMMQRVLEGRFKLRLRRDRKEIRVFELAAPNGAPKLQAAKPATCYALQPDKGPPKGGQPICGNFNPAPRGGVDAASVTMAELCMLLSMRAGRDVLDKTGISGVYDIHLDVGMDQLKFAGGDDPGEAAAALASALKKIGLALQPGKMIVESLSIERVERPTEN